MGVVNLKQFATRLARLTRELPEQQVRAVRNQLALTALRALVFTTPRDTGNAVANWQVTTGSPATGWTPKADRDAQNATVQEGAAAIARAPVYGVVHITNNVPYIEVLNNGGFMPPNPGPSTDPRPGRNGRVLVRNGYSIQAPAGMLPAAVRAIDAELRSVGA